MTRLILVRHGETQYNKEEIFRGTSEVPLNEMGLEQARLLGLALKGESLSAVYTSPQIRAVVTAEEIAGHHGLSPVAEPRLADMNFGEWQGVPLREVKERWPEIYHIWATDPFAAKIPGGQTLREVETAAMAAVLDMEARHPDETVALISHRLVIKVLLGAALEMGDGGFWKLKPDVASISILEKNPRRFVLTLFNDTCHLRGAASMLGDF